MATCRDIVTRALRKLGALALGSDASGAQLAQGMDSLQGLYDTLIGMGALGALRDVNVTADYTARENERIYCTPAVTVTLPTSLPDCNETCRWDYGATYSGPNRPPRDMSVVVISNSVNDTRATWLWDAQIGRWVQTNALEASDEAPLSSRFAGGLAARLALHLSEEYGGQLGPVTASQAAAFLSSITHKAGRRREPVAVDFF